jgi:CheY-like chemotaxis protein
MEIGKGPILLGEDLEDDALLFTISLQKAGATNRVVVLGEGDEILDYLRGAGNYKDRTRFPQPAIVFLDGQLHHQPSMGLLKWIKDHPEVSDVPVFVLTGSLDRKVCEQAKALGALECFEKPFSIQDWRRIQKLIV